MIETAFLKDTRSLKKIQYENAKSDSLEIVSPCGKLNGYSDRCSDCYSFRRESLKIPDTMKLKCSMSCMILFPRANSNMAGTCQAIRMDCDTSRVGTGRNKGQRSRRVIPRTC